MLSCALALALLGTPAPAAPLDLQSIGVITFSPDGVLFVADPKAAAVYALETEVGKQTRREGFAVAELGQKLAAQLGIEASELVIHDLAVNPLTGTPFLSASRGRGPDAEPVLASVMTTSGSVVIWELETLPFTRADLSNAPKDEGEGRRNQRTLSITDMEFHEGALYVAGLSNEEFASKLHTIPYPFTEVGNGTSIEVYHGAHGAWETRSPVRTFTTYAIEDTNHLLAAYTCTPLVKIPIREVLATTEAGAKVRGTTVAELGNRNTPLDMVVYNKDGSEYVLVANTSRGLMKISTQGIEAPEGITKRIDGTAGLTYETVDYLEGVVQLAPYDATRALALIQPEGSSDAHLETIELP
jgi:hypothetical protein